MTVETFLNSALPAALAVIGVLFLIGAPCAVFVLRKNLKTALGVGAFFGTLGIAALILTRLPDIKLFKGLGITAELQQTIREANATIKQLRQLAVTLAEPELSQIAMSGVMLSQLTFTYQYERKQEIVKTLEALGLEQADIDHALRVWTDVTRRKMSKLLCASIKDTKLVDPCLRIRLDAQEQAADPSVLKAFFGQNHLTDEDAVNWLADYEHLFKTGEVRRPELFPIGLSP
jgi:hypothetical protein